MGLEEESEEGEGSRKTSKAWKDENSEEGEEKE
jgi:hypothetical protein